jgi:AbrB family looped-hinge helix DNA binding protein
MRITSKGEVAIPQEIREKLGLLPDTEVEFIVEGNTVRLVKATEPKQPTRGEELVRRLRGAGKFGMTTDEIMRLTRGDD